MKRLWLVFLLAAISWPSFAQGKKSGACFDEAASQTELNMCANDEAKLADAQLDQTYQQLLTIAKGDPVAVAKIKKAESIWTAYRKAYIEAMYPAEDKQAEYGTMFPMGADLLWAKLAREQTEALRDIVKQFNNAK
jgi:uncharacterized protein YecT (DUF1311 family)